MLRKAKTRKICFLIPTVHAGGIETYLLRFLDFLEGSYDITIVVRGHQGGELLKAYQSLNAEIYFKPLGYVNFSRMTGFYKFLKANQFDVICDFNANFAGVPLLLAKMAGVPVRIAFYRQGRDHFSPSLLKNRFNRLMNRLVYRYATDILFNSNAAQDVFFDYRNSEDKRFRVIYNGVDAELFNSRESQAIIQKKLDLPEGKYVIGHVGRFDPAKNHRVILQTAKRLKAKGAEVHFVLCGRETEQLMPEIESMGLQEMFTILGYRKDVAQVLKSFDLFFFPSNTEGQPNALIEAMISGLPVVASNIPPISECLPSDFNNYLADPNDSETFLEIILRQMESRSNNISEMKDWSSSKFDSKKNFNLFKEVLDK